MADADASAAFELEDDSLTAGLDGIAAKFEAIATQINAGFAGANAQLGRTAAATAGIGASAPLMSRLAAGMALAARAAQMVATAVSGIVTTAMRLAPWVKYIPDSLGKWVAPVKKAASGFVHLSAQIGTVVKSAQALTGRLTVLNAGFMALELRELGASKGMAVLGAAGALATSKIIAGARTALGAVGMLGSGIAGAAGRAMRGVSGITGGLGRSLGTASMFIAPMAGLALALGPVGAAAAGVAAGFSAVKKSVAAAGETQSLQSSFITLLGSADAAKKRMAELSRFAAETPFEIPGVVRASRVLETLTHGALSTGAGLRMVGDIASISGQPIEDLSVHVGRLYDGLMNGRAVGESLMRLQELGLVSSATRSQIEALQASGAKGGEVWTLAAKDMMRFSGEMKRQSNTWEGALSNTHDAVGQLFRAFGAPVISAITPFLVKLNNWLGTLTKWAERAGTIFAAWSATILQTFADGKLSQVLMLAGKIGFMEAVNFLAAGMVGAANAFATLVAGVAKNLLILLSEATTAEFWSGLGNALKSAGQALIAILLEGVAKVLDAMRDIPGIGDKAGRAADSAHGMAEKFASGSADAAAKAATNLAPLFSRLEANIKQTFANIGKAFTAGRSSFGNLFDAGGEKAELMKILQGEWAKAKQGIDATKKAAEKGGLPPPLPSPSDDTGKGKANVAGLQQIAGGGGFSVARDPVVAATNSVGAKVDKTTSAVEKVATAIANWKPDLTPRFA